MLAAALLIVGFLFVKGPLEEHLANHEFSSDMVLGNAFALFVLWRAFRGGRLSLKLAKGVVVLFATLSLVLVTFIVSSLCLGKALPSPPTFANTAPFLGVVAALAYASWALFFSRDVKDYVAFRRREDELKRLNLPTGQVRTRAPI